MKDIVPHAHALYIIGNGFDLMHRTPSSYYSFRDSLGKRNRLRESLEMALTAEDIWADFENSLGSLNLDLMGSRHIVDMWLDDFGIYDDEDAGAAEYYMAVEAAATPIINLVNELQPAFRRWVNSLEAGTNDRPLADLIRTDGKVLDFNYTEFIETLYGVRDVCYIHGNRKRKGKLILGHRPGAESLLHEKERGPKSYRQTIKQWLALNGINEKQYFYWQRKVRQSVAAQLDLPAVRQEAEVTLAQIRVESEPDPKTAFLPAAVIHTDRATIEISAFAPAALTKQIMKVLSNAV